VAVEIERRFLVKGSEWKKHIEQKEEFKQGYLSTNFDQWIVRFRIIDNKKSFMTIKKSIGEMTSNEFEWDIPLKEAENIWNLISYKVIKKRYTVIINGLSWVVDCFEDKNSPLIIAEIELPSTDINIVKPSWCTVEVTHMKELSNAALSRFPLSRWKKENLVSLNLD
tara:strand:- start:1395 stop:1895 length:501 start_codon:yes stop_codon:yes gene_type:complete